MKEAVRALLDLKSFDDKLAHLKARMEDGPRILAKRSSEMSEVEKGVTAKKAEIQEVKVRIKNWEMELSQREETIKKQELHLLAAKSNEEYKGHQNEIQRLKDEVGGIEESILEAFEQVEQKTSELKELEADLKVHVTELGDFKKEIEAEMDEYAVEVKQLEERRAEAAEGIPFKVIDIYEKVREAREGVGLACADGGTCGGCYMSITANDMQRLLTLKDVVTCRSCQRILYLSDSVR